MYGSRPFVQTSIALVTLALASRLFAQTTDPAAAHDHQETHESPAQSDSPTETAQPHEHAHDHAHDMSGLSLFPAREASGTAWLPDDAPMYAAHWNAGAWQLMAHGNLFVQYLYESGDRGATQFGSINWIMGMARRPIGSGRFGVRLMLSLEPWTIRGCGYPDLLATGEQCRGETIHDRQHPHDLLMEAAADYDRPLARGLRWQVYAGLAGEPALGPVSYPHRPSAMANPIAPIVHHWLDSTHITFGVATAGVYGTRWKAEASAFNGREPDEQRTDLDLGPLDSYSGRLSYLPSSGVALQVSAGRLRQAELGVDGRERIDIDRITASATYHRSLTDHGLWASTIAWGRNSEVGEATQAILAETTLTVRARDAWFGRFEAGRKDAHDLGTAESQDTFPLSKWQGGYVRYLAGWRGVQAGLGGGLSAGVVPSALEPAYGRRVNLGFSLFASFRPLARH
jgi:hypothetical protein